MKECVIAGLNRFLGRAGTGPLPNLQNFPRLPNVPDLQISCPNGAKESFLTESPHPRFAVSPRPRVSASPCLRFPASPCLNF